MEPYIVWEYDVLSGVVYTLSFNPIGDVLWPLLHHHIVHAAIQHIARVPPNIMAPQQNAFLGGAALAHSDTLLLRTRCPRGSEKTGPLFRMGGMGGGKRSSQDVLLFQTLRVGLLAETEGGRWAFDALLA
jgi:hypothetical protein